MTAPAPFVAISVGLADRLIKRLAEDTDVVAREMKTELMTLLGDARAHQQHVDMLAEELLVTLARESGRQLPARLDATSLLAAKAAICSMARGATAEVIQLHRLPGGPEPVTLSPGAHELLLAESEEKRDALLDVLAELVGKALPRSLDDHAHAMATVRSWVSARKLDAVATNLLPITWAVHVDGSRTVIMGAAFVPQIGSTIVVDRQRCAVMHVNAPSGEAVEILRSEPARLVGGFVLTAEHTHVCALCSADTPCSVEGCRATGLRCPTCESKLEEVDALPAVRRPDLSFAGAVELLELATRRASECARGPRPHNAIRIFDAVLEHIAPVDPTSDDADTWIRLGVLVGGSDAWAKRAPRKHGDWPSVRAMFCYNLAYCAAVMVVQHVRSMEMKA